MSQYCLTSMSLLVLLNIQSTYFSFTGAVRKEQFLSACVWFPSGAYWFLLQERMKGTSTQLGKKQKEWNSTLICLKYLWLNRFTKNKKNKKKSSILGNATNVQKIHLYQLSILTWESFATSLGLLLNLSLISSSTLSSSTGWPGLHMAPEGIGEEDACKVGLEPAEEGEVR